MAQTGYTPILIYSSSTVSQAPSAGNLTNSTLGSELAINITDGKLFYKDNTNAIQVIGWKTTPTTAGGTGLTSYTAGDLLYYASGTTLTKLAIGASTTIMTSSGTAPQWSAASGITVGKATNLDGGVAGSVPYQTGVGTTTFLGIGAANTVLTSSGSAPQWSTNLNIGSLTATSMSDSGNLTFTGTGNRIIGDFSNGTFASRVAFQTSTANSPTTVYAIPNGTSTTSGFFASTDSAVTNGSEIRALVNGTVASLTSSFRGTGTTLPLVFDVAGERVRIFTSGGVSIGDTTDPGAGNLRLGTGNLVIGTSGKGIDFSAAGGDILTTYDEQTFTPTWNGGTVTVNSSNVTKIGRQVTWILDVVFGSSASGTDSQLTLPFTATGSWGGGSINFTDYGTGTTVNVDAVANRLLFRAADNSTNLSCASVATKRFICVVIYFA